MDERKKGQKLKSDTQPVEVAGDLEKCSKFQISC